MIDHLKAFLATPKRESSRAQPERVAPYGAGLRERPPPVPRRQPPRRPLRRLPRDAAARSPGRCEPAALDRGAVRSFLAAELHAAGQSRATSARKLAAIRTFLRYLRREELVEGDPGSLVATPKREIRMPAHLSEREMTVLLETPSVADPLGRRDRAILELFYASGLRLSELANLDVDDVNLRARMARVLGKGGKERMVPFNGSTAAAIRQYLPDREELVTATQAAPPAAAIIRASRCS